MPHHPALPPLTSAAYALLLAAFLFAVDQVTNTTENQTPWFQLAGGSLVTGWLLTAGVFGLTGWRRRREGEPQRAALWGLGAAGSVLFGALSLFVLVQVVDVLTLLYGADVHLTQPIIEGLPRPADAILMSEHPGPAQTETIYEDFRVTRRAGVLAFYRAALPRAGWTEEARSSTSAGAGSGMHVDFDKGQFVASVSFDPSMAPDEYLVTVTHLPPELPASPSPAAS